MQQLSLFDEIPDRRPPQTVTWNLWHGCTKVSPGCRHCYMFRRDESVGKDPAIVAKTSSFSLPVRILRSGAYKGSYKIPPGSTIYTCFSSDFFHADADDWRPYAWEMIRERSDCIFYMITKRPERIADHLPSGWGEGWEHVHISVTCENQQMANQRLPIYLELPLSRRSVTIEPMLSAVSLQPYLVSGKIHSVTVGGESGPDARACEFRWVRDIFDQCAESKVDFFFHQTGACLLKDGKTLYIPRHDQHRMAQKLQAELQSEATNRV